MFSEVPHRYDIINRLFTLRLDEKWRAMAAAECLKNEPARVLDLCTGTGDMAIRLAAKAGTRTLICGVDFSMPMLDAARQKSAGTASGTRFVLGDAAGLPFKDGSFPVIGTAFAFRNLTFRNPNRHRHLSELLRVLMPGGKLVIVESSQPRKRIVRFFTHLYLRAAVSFMGGLISGKPGAYRYLVYSAVNYFKPEELSELLRAAGFNRVEYRPLLAGIAAIHVAYK
ncbi:MAG: hypothetical protein A2176_03350 [Spirochaetes bacterium RBG_13_51_14]|nr:MAG: hypothetical protein A2176_03350 [Spirochaetes bacterium RBG_13_51_14]